MTELYSLVVFVNEEWTSARYEDSPGHDSEFEIFKDIPRAKVIEEASKAYAGEHFGTSGEIHLFAAHPDDAASCEGILKEAEDLSVGLIESAKVEAARAQQARIDARNEGAKQAELRTLRRLQGKYPEE